MITRRYIEIERQHVAREIASIDLAATAFFQVRGEKLAPGFFTRLALQAPAVVRLRLRFRQRNRDAIRPRRHANHQHRRQRPLPLAARIGLQGCRDLGIGLRRDAHRAQ